MLNRTTALIALSIAIAAVATARTSQAWAPELSQPGAPTPTAVPPTTLPTGPDARHDPVKLALGASDPRVVERALIELADAVVGTEDVDSLRETARTLLAREDTPTRVISTALAALDRSWDAEDPTEYGRIEVSLDGEVAVGARPTIRLDVVGAADHPNVRVFLRGVSVAGREYDDAPPLHTDTQLPADLALAAGKAKHLGVPVEIRAAGEHELLAIMTIGLGRDEQLRVQQRVRLQVPEQGSGTWTIVPEPPSRFGFAAEP